MKWFLIILTFCVAVNSQAEIVVQDDLGRKVALNGPAQRVISLAPHLTEIVYAVGGGEQMAATVAWSDFPEEAKSLPVIGSNNKINYELLLSYQPDLILVWRSGNGEGIYRKLEELGLNVYVNEPKKLESIPKTVTKIGRLLGRNASAQQVSNAFSETLALLRNTYQGKRSVDVYYQIWQSPLITFGGEHLVSDVISLCGGNNVFGSLKPLVPRVSVESVLLADPEVIVVGQYMEVDTAFAQWQKWAQIKAVQKGNLYSVDPYQLHRHTPRILLGATELCERIESARLKMSA